jgi:hypothetical protein
MLRPDTTLDTCPTILVSVSLKRKKMMNIDPSPIDVDVDLVTDEESQVLRKKRKKI